MNAKPTTALTVLLVAVVAVAPAVGVVSLPAAAASTTNVSVSPNSTTVEVGGTATYEIVVDNTDGGVGAWEGTLNLTDGSVADITNVSLQGSPGISTVRIAGDNDSVYFDAALADTNDTGEVAIATVTVESTGQGTTDLNLTMDAVGDESGSSYTVSQVNDGSLTAVASVTNVSVSPESKNATVGTTTTVDVVVDDADGGVGAWEGTLNLTNSDVADITNVSLQGNPGISTVRFADDNDSVYFDAALADTADTGAVTIVTVTLRTTNNGATGLNLTMAALGDEGGSSYNIDKVNDGFLAAGAVPEYSNLSVNQTAGTAPFTVNASATVENVGGESGTVTVPLVVDNQTVATKDVTLSSGESVRVSFDYEFTTPGEKNLTIGPLAPTTIDVNGAPTAAIEANKTDVNISEVVGLNASVSSDPDGDQLTYAWDLDGDGNYTDAETAATTVAFDTPGTYTVSVRVDDGMATDTATVTITVSDVTPPTPAFVIDEDGDGTDDTSTPTELGTTLTFNASDSSDNVAIAAYDWGVVSPTGEQVETLTNETTTFTPDGIGTYNVTLRVTDTSGNNDSVTESFAVEDTTPPTVALTGPAQPIINITTTFDASNTTDNGDVQYYLWDFDGNGTIDANTSQPTAGYEYTDANQTYTVSVTAVDQSGNNNTTSIQVNTSRAPAIEVTSPEDGAFTNADTVNVAYATDNLDAGDADGVQYRVDGGEWQDAPSLDDAAVAVADPAEGNHTVTFRIIDSNGQRLLPGISATIATVNFTVDRTAPSLTIDDPGEGDVVYGSTLNFNISDENLQNATYQFAYFNGTTSANKTLSAPYTVSTDGIPEGPTNVTVYTRDKAGNVESQTFSFDLVSNPDIADLQPNETVVNTSNPTVTAAYSDNQTAGDLGVNVSAVRLAVNGTELDLTGQSVTNESLSVPISLSPSNPGDATYQLTLTVVDEAGHATTKTTTFVVDTVAPTVGLNRDITDRVSTNNPVTFTASSNDVRPEATWVNVTQNGETIQSYDVTGGVASGATTVVWNATYSNGTAVENGVYNVTIRSVDTVGNVRTRTKTVTVDNEPPTVSVGSVASNGESVTPPNGSLFVDSTVTMSGTADGTPGDADSVTVVVEATFTNFRTTADVTQSGGSWTADLNASDLPDEGNYTVTARATDPANNEQVNATGTVLQVDRTDPSLGATVFRKNTTHGRVNLTVSEPIDESTLNVTVVLGNGTSQQVTMSQSQNPSVYTGTFPLSNRGTQYLVSAKASDSAGNAGSDTAAATIITSVDTKNKTVTVLSNATGTFVQFNTSEDVNNTFITLTASDAPLRPLTNDLVGGSFLNSEQGEALTQNMTNATIGIPINNQTLPENVDPQDVTIRRFNETTNSWEEPEDTRIEQVELEDGTNGTYWLANVSEFSTYGAIVEDSDAPTLSLSGPSGDLDYGDTDANVRFEYGDELSDVNASAIELYFDGEEVTDSENASITSSYATYNTGDLATGQSYTARVKVVDEAGNAKNYTTTFTVVQDTNSPTIDSFTPTDGTQFDAATDTVTIDVAYSDDVSGVDTSAVTVYFDGTDVTSDATIGSSSLSYTASGLSDNSTHTVRVVIDDVAANGPTEQTITFSIDEADEATGGGGGGGGGGGDDESQATISFTDLDTGATISVRGAANGETITQDLGTSVSSERMGLRAVTLQMQFANSQFRLEISNPSDNPQGGAPALDKGPAISYFQVDAVGLPNSDISSAEFEFTVQSSALPAGASMDDVVLYRYHDGSWEAMDTTHQGNGFFTASLPGFSTFAVGVESADQATTTATPTVTETQTPTGTETPPPTTTATTEGTTPTETDTEVSTQITFPGFGAVVAVLALLLSALLLRRKE